MDYCIHDLKTGEVRFYETPEEVITELCGGTMEEIKARAESPENIAVYRRVKHNLDLHALQKILQAQ